MQYSFEDALMGDEKIEESPGFSYNITDVAFSGMAEIIPKIDRERIEGKTDKQAKQAQNPECEGLRKYTGRTSKWSTEEKNEFIARNNDQEWEARRCELYFPKMSRFEKPTIKGLYGPDTFRRKPNGPSDNARFNYGLQAQY